MLYKLMKKITALLKALLTPCEHKVKIDVVVETATTCEIIWTKCARCRKILNKRLEC